MDREPIIWRPNAISQREWDSKSREEQIAWWRASRQDDSNSKRSMLDLLPFYENGTITLSECFTLICNRATHDETPGFLIECPNEIITMLREELEKYIGNDPQKWPRTFYIASYARWITAEEIEASRERKQQLLWSGIAILKSNLGNGG